MGLPDDALIVNMGVFCYEGEVKPWSQDHGTAWKNHAVMRINTRMDEEDINAFIYFNLDGAASPPGIFYDFELAMKELVRCRLAGRPLKLCENIKARLSRAVK